jgi:hypothetical protein
MLRDVGQQIRLAAELKDAELLDSFGYDWYLETLAEDLQSKDHVLELYRQRESIENLLVDAIEEPVTFPALTPEYCELADHGAAILAPYFEEIYSKVRRAA